jgi:hypothetical protein
LRRRPDLLAADNGLTNHPQLARRFGSVLAGSDPILPRQGRQFSFVDKFLLSHIAD